MGAARGPGGFAPLRHATFRRLWIAQFTSNVGGWMQTVGAQWLMLSLSGSAAYLAFIQSAASLPVLLFAIPAGALADLVDRRKLLMWSTTFMIFASVLLAALTLADLVTPWVLLALLFAVGAGQAWTSPAWQSLQPELVPVEERPQAIALGSVNQNLARAAGPAIGGAVVALTEPSVTFMVNAASFVAVVFALWRWRSAPRPSAESTLPREHVVAAMRASGRYVRNSPALRTVLGRAAAFMVCASALWALLPAIASGPLELGSGGYGLLLGCVGIGAVGGAIVLPRLRARWAPDPTLAVGSLLVAASAFVLAEVHVVALAAVALVVAGCGWIVALATLNSSYQALLPGWIKARGLSYYLIVFQGGTAIGSAIMGLLAGWLGVTEVLAGAAVALALTPLLSLVTTIRRFSPDELLPAGGEPAPHVLTAADAESGPVQVRIRRHAAPGREQDLVDAIASLEKLRRRTGAIAWTLWRDTADPSCVIEEFLLTSWTDHERQHERLTIRDRTRLDDVLALTDREPSVEHDLQAIPRPPDR